MSTLLKVLPICLLLPACAVSESKLAIDTASAAQPGAALSRAPATGFAWEALADARRDTARVGYKENGMGMKLADIDTQQPVTRLVTDAINAGLSANDFVGRLVSDEVLAAALAARRP